jgi:UDP-N-acetylglucosamine--N-acetylmuramyl-(pentapeptide) pyrophosphoryl-undecaprenol N-acetylglucosamine transferase
LLIASAGGHLEELVRLAPRLGVTTDRVWVTYDVPHAQVLLDNEHVVVAHHPTTRSLLNAVRNYRLARGVLLEHKPSVVISTGAAVAVPFFSRARRQRIACHYIESAARVEGPSLSGRLLERISGVHLYRQLGTWGQPRWRQGPSVFDGFAAMPARDDEAGRTKGDGARRLVVSLGTNRFAFPRLVERISALAPADAGIVWQLGSTRTASTLPGRTTNYLGGEELRIAIRDADVVVGHAGVGLALTALTMGKVPVLVPRRRRRREHTDDHQVQIARELDRKRLAVVAEVGELTGEHLQRAANLVATWHEPPPFEFGD